MGDAQNTVDIPKENPLDNPADMSTGRPISNPLGETLHYLKLSGAFYCKSEMNGTWGISLPSMPNTSMFHIVTAGACVIEHGEQRIEAKAGDFIFIPKGLGHIVRSDDEADTEDLFSLPREQISHCYETLKMGDEGDKTTILCGVVQLDHPCAEFIIDSMPDMIYLESAKSTYSSWMSNTVRVISEEAEQTQIGGETILTRLADVLVIQALRYWITHNAEAKQGWLFAMKDRRIGKSLSLIHSNPERQWTLESLGREIGMSRTAFASNFTALVGEPMLQYLTKWRMNLAVMRLKEGEKVTPELIEQLGYRSESAFRRTFKKVTGKNTSAFQIG
jgi:AraC-like DNA-binding protein/mannose-6-phosphate isomerase-like protein (cupin superfamily)